MEYRINSIPPFYFWIRRNSMILELPPVMPESGGEVDLLPPSTLTTDILPCRRRLGLRLDFGADDYTCVPKRCKLESMNISISHVSALNKINASNNNVNAVFTARTMPPQELASRMNKSRTVLVLDCRPFVSYNIAHIQGAVNVNCSDRFNRRRLQQGKASIVDLVASKEGKDMFKKRSSKEIVIYDDHTKDVQSLSSESSMYLVLSSLLREGKDAYILKGSYFSFIHISLLIMISEKNVHISWVNLKSCGFIWSRHDS